MSPPINELNVPAGDLLIEVGEVWQYQGEDSPWSPTKGLTLRTLETTNRYHPVACEVIDSGEHKIYPVGYRGAWYLSGPWQRLYDCEHALTWALV